MSSKTPIEPYQDGPPEAQSSFDLDDAISVTDGATCIGFIREAGGTATALDASGGLIGNFASRKARLPGVSEAHAAGGRP